MKINSNAVQKEREREKKNTPSPEKIKQTSLSSERLRGIVSRDFGWLQMILMDKAWVLDIPLEFFFTFPYCFKLS